MATRKGPAQQTEAQKENPFNKPFESGLRPQALENPPPVDERAPALAQGARIPFPRPEKHGHYFRDVSQLHKIDIYRILERFNVTDPCLQHAIKKLLVAGGRGAGKDIQRDVQESIDTLRRWVDMRMEDGGLV